MRVEKHIKVLTSIAPGGIENQQRAMASWRSHGFQVVSLNAADEIELLSPSFQDVVFVKVDRDARQEYGKPFVYFDDFMAYFLQQDAAICGMVNSDIHLISEHPFMPFIEKEAQGCLVFGSRVDVDALAVLQGEMYHKGFDYFFFDRKLLDLFPQEEFCIGQPWWDFWLPVVPLGVGLPVKRLMTPVAYHVKHAINWNPQVWIQLGKVMGKYFPTPEHINAQNIMLFSKAVCKFILENAKEIHLS